MDATLRSKAEICALLNEFLYLGFKDAGENDTLADIIAAIESNPKKYESFIKKDEFTILKANLDRIGDYQIGNQSWNLSQFNSGTGACTFTDPDSGKIYVVYRGTGDGEWLDNGLGMTQASTRQQEEAARYFDYVVEHNGLNGSDDITVTGHSKGGNKSQYVTVNSEYKDYIDQCISLDGQGFSPEAIAAFKEKYGEEAYQAYLEKMYSICGENDYVNPLGVKIILDGHTYYIKTPATDDNFVAGHDLKYYFALYDENGNPVFKDGQQQFGSSMNPEAERGLLALNAEELSKALMRLPPDKRQDAAMVIMQLMEATEGEKIGLYGEQCTIENIIGFLKDGVPVILFTLLTTPEGLELLAHYGGELLQKAYEELGPVKFAGVVAAVVLLAPLAVKLIKGAYVVLAFLDGVIDFIDKMGDFLADIGTFIKTICSEAKVLYESWLIGRKIDNPAKSYVPGDEIAVNTGRIRQIIATLNHVQNKITRLDNELNTLRRNQEWYEVFKKLRIGSIDFLYVGYDDDLNRCITYLNNLAASFESIERSLNNAACGY